tara:strand:+ start:61 stop:732 length:672 start_codon:yes stop_codon:yes gene_type:complete
MKKTLLFSIFFNFIIVNAQNNTTQYGNATNTSNATTITTTTPSIIHTTTPTEQPTTTTKLRSTTTTISVTTTTEHPTTTRIATTTNYVSETTTTPQSTTTTETITTTQIKKPIVYCNNETWNSSCIQCIGPLCKFVKKGEQGIGLEILFVTAFIAFIGLTGLFGYTKCIKPVLYHNIAEEVFFESDDSDFEDEAMPLNVEIIRNHSKSPEFEIATLHNDKEVP